MIKSIWFQKPKVSCEDEIDGSGFIKLGLQVSQERHCRMQIEKSNATARAFASSVIHTNVRCHIPSFSESELTSGK